MKKSIIIAAIAAIFSVNVNAQCENDCTFEANVADVIAELSLDDALQFIPMYQKMLTDIEKVSRNEKMDDGQKTARIEDLKDEYTEKFSTILVTAQNEVAINSIPMEYINSRLAK